MVSRKRRIWLAIAVVVVGVGALLLWPSSDPLLRPTEVIRADLLEMTPLGTSRQAVQELVAERRWGRVGGIEPDDAIGARIGTHRGFFGEVQLWAFWLFDHNDKLVDVHVYTMSVGL